MAPFLDSLAREDLASATLRGYRYDLRHFLACHATVQPDGFALDRLAEFELIAYRLQHRTDPVSGSGRQAARPTATCPGAHLALGATRFGLSGSARCDVFC